MIEDDINSIADLERKTFTDAWTEQSIQGAFLQKQAFIVVSEMDDHVVGYCIMYYVLDEGEIARIAVDGSQRRKGIGRKILDEVKKACQEKGISRILLDVRESNTSARDFYESYGFQIDGVRKNFYDFPKENAILMSKNIG